MEVLKKDNRGDGQCWYYTERPMIDDTATGFLEP